MKQTTTEIISREGWIELGVLYSLFMGSLSLELSLLSFLLFVLVMLRTYYYRNPERLPYDMDEFALLSPVDGEVLSVNSTKKSVEIVIKNSFFDTHIIRSPIEGNLSQDLKVYGLSFRDFSRAVKLNSKRSFSVGSVIVQLFFFDDSDTDSLYFSDAQRVFKGERVGFVKGGFCLITIPLNRVNVAVGDRVEAGRSTIAFLN